MCVTAPGTERYLTAADLAKDLRHAQEAPQRRKRRLTAIATAVAGGLVVLVAVWGWLVVAGNRPMISVQPAAGLKIRHRATLRGHTDAVWSVAFSPDDRWLASAGVDMTVKLWDVPDAQQLACARRDGKISLWKTDGTAGPVEFVAGPSQGARWLSWAPDSKSVAFSNERDFGIARLDNRSVSALSQATAEIDDLAWKADGTQFFSRGKDNRVRVFSPDGRLVTKVVTDCEAATWQPDGRLALLCKKGVHFHRTNATAGSSDDAIQDRKTWDLYGGTWNPDGTLVAKIQRNKISLREANGTEPKTLEGHKTDVCSVACGTRKTPRAMPCKISAQIRTSHTVTALMAMLSRVRSLTGFTRSFSKSPRSVPPRSSPTPGTGPAARQPSATVSRT